METMKDAVDRTLANAGRARRPQSDGSLNGLVHHELPEMYATQNRDPMFVEVVQPKNTVAPPMNSDLLKMLAGMNAYIDHISRRLTDVVDILAKMSEDAKDKAEQPMVDKVADVIKGIIGGKVHAKQVDELHTVTGRSKQDRAVGKAFQPR